MSHYHKQREAHAEAQRQEDKKCAKVSMPEPLAYCGQGLKPIYANHMDVVKRRDPTLIPFYDTTLYDDTRLEAYANARVREALDEAAMILKANAEECNIDTARILRSNAEAIRALIPKE